MGDINFIGLNCEWGWVTVTVSLILWPHMKSQTDTEQQHWWTMYEGDRKQHLKVLEAQKRREIDAALVKQQRDLAQQRVHQQRQQQMHQQIQQSGSSANQNGQGVGGANGDVDMKGGDPVNGGDGGPFEQLE